MLKIQVFDPPMCCSTGVCGSDVDPVLVRFAGDLEWLKRQGVEVVRYNLSQNPGVFADTPMVKSGLDQEGNKCLPLILVDGEIVSSGKYPDREALAGFARMGFQTGIFTNAVGELVAIGAAIASNCEPCFKFHFNEARKLGVSKEDIGMAVAMAQAVKERPARAVLALAEKILGSSEKHSEQGCSIGKPEEGGKCCG